MGTGPLAQQSRSVKREEEQLLVDRCRQGDRDSFAQLMRLHQDIFVAAFRGIRRFRGEAKFSTWLYRIALNQTRNRIKYLTRRDFFARQSRRTQYREERAWENPEFLADSAPTPEQWTLTKSMATQVQQCLNQMAPQARQILVLRDVQGFSYEELGEMLSLNPGTVKSRLHRARATLQQCLADKLE